MIVLKALSKGEMSGYSLIKHIEKEIGEKPSTGSIYPILDNMLKNGQVNVRKLKRKKLYRFTNDGKKALHEVTNKKESIITDLIKHIRLCSCLCDDKEKTRSILKEIENKLCKLK